MNKKVISKATMERIVKQLANLEDQKSIILKKYYSEPSEKRDKFKNMIQKYISYTENFLKNVSVVDEESVSFPFVTIDSNVEVIDLEEDESYTLRVVSPLIEETPVNVNCVSYLSPVGSALLLKEINDEINIEFSSQTLKYKINNVWLMDA